MLKISGHLDLGQQASVTGSGRDRGTGHSKLRRLQSNSHALLHRVACQLTFYASKVRHRPVKCMTLHSMPQNTNDIGSLRRKICFSEHTNTSTARRSDCLVLTCQSLHLLTFFANISRVASTGQKQPGQPCQSWFAVRSTDRLVTRTPPFITNRF